MKSSHRRLVGVAIGVTLATTATTPSFAAATRAAAPSIKGQSAAAAVGHTHPRYSDSEVVGLLVFATGPAADANPSLAASIRGDRPAARVTPAQVAAFTTELSAIDPSFHELVTLGLQKNDPFAAETAIGRLKDDVTLWLKKRASPGNTPASRASGWFYTTSYVAVLTNVAAAWQVAAAHTVAAGMTVAVVLVIFPAAVSYQFQAGDPNSLQRQDFAARVAATLK